MGIIPYKYKKRLRVFRHGGGNTTVPLLFIARHLNAVWSHKGYFGGCLSPLCADGRTSQISYPRLLSADESLSLRAVSLLLYPINASISISIIFICIFCCFLLTGGNIRKKIAYKQTFATKIVFLLSFSFYFAQILYTFAFHKLGNSFQMVHYALVAKFVDLCNQSVEEVAVVAHQYQRSVECL